MVNKTGLSMGQTQTFTQKGVFCLQMSDEGLRQNLSSSLSKTFKTLLLAKAGGFFMLVSFMS